MVATDKLMAFLKTFARTLVTDYPVDDMLAMLCRETCSILECGGAGVMLEDEAGDLRFVAASDDVVCHIETLQVELGEGPCLLSYRTSEVTLARDLTTDDRFPRFSQRAVALGMASVHSFPLMADDTCVGALNLYSAEVAPFGEEDIEAGQLIADVCTTYILNARNLAESHKIAGQLQRALDSRVVIEQAKGTLAEQLGINVSDAFEILRRHARSTGRKLHDVAGEVVAGTLKLSGPA